VLRIFSRYKYKLETYHQIQHWHLRTAAVVAPAEK